jgi:hypothetical protein
MMEMLMANMEFLLLLSIADSGGVEGCNLRRDGVASESRGPLFP